MHARTHTHTHTHTHTFVMLQSSLWLPARLDPHLHLLQIDFITKQMQDIPQVHALCTHKNTQRKTIN